jgi:hypothetical protein
VFANIDFVSAACLVHKWQECARRTANSPQLLSGKRATLDGFTGDNRDTKDIAVMPRIASRNRANCQKHAKRAAQMQADQTRQKRR